MANTSVISASRYIIMYTNSIAITSFRGDDGITAQLLHCFQTCPAGITSGRAYYTSVFPISQCRFRHRERLFLCLCAGFERGFGRGFDLAELFDFGCAMFFSSLMIHAITWKTTAKSLMFDSDIPSAASTVAISIRAAS